ncbi:efflux transporter outer membrane subunit [Methylomonas fluvii]|uniref:Efflux transporter outer membrane subunit n=1 Tax=Methylomonas fluvii TaxID=1854564 RepID=A0ABR9DEQ5_9GAMM|nr:efflux transporter outer membrane subunit [Methylomonas fluvii]MBD9361543.1 efflux transporter outer membrane subunit [Methylomonas fluvii]CAD6874508.1 RND efflux system, outer membrane lipoprotein, NodT family [Methylomonas fluvii]
MFPLLAFIVLPACHSIPERDPNTLDIALPAQWQSPALPRDQSVTDWLTTFNDHTLTSLIEDGLIHNFDLQAAAARVDAAKEQATIAGAGRLPQLYFTPGYQRGKDALSSESGQLLALFNLSWELDVWGRIKASQQAALEEAVAVSEDYQAARLSLAAGLAQVYFQWLEARLQAQVAAQSVKDRSVIVELVRGRFNKGLTRGLDLRLALTDLANAEAQSAQMHNDVQLLHKQLQTLLGRYPSFDVTTVDYPANEFAPTKAQHLPEPPVTLAAGLPSELLNRRPDVVAAFKRLQAADQRLASSEKALLPRVTLTAIGGTSSPALTEIIDPRAAAWNLAAGLAQPLFTGDRLQADIRLKQANVEDAYNQYQSVALKAFREVEQTLAAESHLREQEQALREAVSQTEASRKLAVYSYRQGLIEILTLLDSYRSTLNAQSAHLAVQRQLLTNRISLYLALGGAV